MDGALEQSLCDQNNIQILPLPELVNVTGPFFVAVTKHYGYFLVNGMHLQPWFPRLREISSVFSISGVQMVYMPSGSLEKLAVVGGIHVSFSGSPTAVLDTSVAQFSEYLSFPALNIVRGDVEVRVPSAPFMVGRETDIQILSALEIVAGNVLIDYAFKRSDSSKPVRIPIFETLRHCASLIVFIYNAEAESSTSSIDITPKSLAQLETISGPPVATPAMPSDFATCGTKTISSLQIFLKGTNAAGQTLTLPTFPSLTSIAEGGIHVESWVIAGITPQTQASEPLNNLHLFSNLVGTIHGDVSVAVAPSKPGVAIDILDSLTAVTGQTHISWYLRWKSPSCPPPKTEQSNNLTLLQNAVALGSLLVENIHISNLLAVGEKLQHVNGNFALFDVTFPVRGLRNLSHVEGNMSICSAACGTTTAAIPSGPHDQNGTSLSTGIIPPLPALKSISGSLEIVWEAEDIDMYNFPTVTAADHSLDHNSLSLSALTYLGGNIRIVNVNIRTLGLQRISHIGGFFEVSGTSAYVGESNLVGLTALGHGLILSNNAGLVTIDFFSNVQNTNGSGVSILQNTALQSISLPSLETASSLAIANNSNLADTSFSALSTVTADVVIQDNDQLGASVVVAGGTGPTFWPLLTLIGGSLCVDENDALPAIELVLPAVSSVGKDVRITSNAVLDWTGDAWPLGSLPGGSLTISGNPKLTNAGLVSNLVTVAGNVSLLANNLSSWADNAVQQWKLTNIRGSLIVSDNMALTGGLQPLFNLLTVGGDVIVQHNPELNYLFGLQRLTFVGRGALITNNSRLCYPYLTPWQIIVPKPSLQAVRVADNTQDESRNCFPYTQWSSGVDVSKMGLHQTYFYGNKIPIAWTSPVLTYASTNVARFVAVRMTVLSDSSTIDVPTAVVFPAAANLSLPPDQTEGATFAFELTGAGIIPKRRINVALAAFFFSSNTDPRALKTNDPNVKVADSVSLCTAESTAATVFCSAGQRLVGQNCSACPAGTFKPPAEYDLTAESVCVVDGVDSLEFCWSCPIGMYSSAMGASTAATCKLCPPGTFTDAPGQTDCRPCPLGGCMADKFSAQLVRAEPAIASKFSVDDQISNSERTRLAIFYALIGAGVTFVVSLLFFFLFKVYSPHGWLLSKVLNLDFVLSSPDLEEDTVLNLDHRRVHVTRSMVRATATLVAFCWIIVLTGFVTHSWYVNRVQEVRTIVPGFESQDQLRVQPLQVDVDILGASFSCPDVVVTGHIVSKSAIGDSNLITVPVKCSACTSDPTCVHVAATLDIEVLRAEQQLEVIVSSVDPSLQPPEPLSPILLASAFAYQLRAPGWVNGSSVATLTETVVSDNGESVIKAMEVVALVLPVKYGSQGGFELGHLSSTSRGLNGTLVDGNGNGDISAGWGLNLTFTLRRPDFHVLVTAKDLRDVSSLLTQVQSVGIGITQTALTILLAILVLSKVPLGILPPSNESASDNSENESTTAKSSRQPWRRKKKAESLHFANPMWDANLESGVTDSDCLTGDGENGLELETISAFVHRSNGNESGHPELVEDRGDHDVRVLPGATVDSADA